MEKEELYLKIGNSLDNTEQSQFFGKPCFKVNNKAFCSFFQNCMVFKLKAGSEQHSDALSLDGSILFDPSGKNRPMKEWVQVPYDYKDKWTDFALASKQYVESIS